MSISATYFIDRSVARAAKELDLILALVSNKVPRESAKLRAVAATIEQAKSRYEQLIGNLGMTQFEAGELVMAKVKEMREAQFAEVKRLREARARAIAEREELLASGIIPA